MFVRILCNFYYPSCRNINEIKCERTPISGSVKLVQSLLSVHGLAGTPTTVHCYGPEVDLSNRVTRKFKDKIDNFLHVYFVEEVWDEVPAITLTTGFANISTRYSISPLKVHLCRHFFLRITWRQPLLTKTNMT